GDDGRHALVARAPGVGIDRFADARLLGVLEAPALGDREIVHAGFGEARAEPRGVLDVAAAGDHVVTEVTDADDVIAADARAHRAQDFQRQAHAMLARAAVAVVPRVQPREKQRHPVALGLVQLDAVEAGLARAAAGLGEEARQHARQLADVGQVRVPDALAIAVVERLAL